MKNRLSYFLMFLVIVAIILGAVLFSLFLKQKDTQVTIMKDVGEAYMVHFGLTDSDFNRLEDADIDIIEGNFDICAKDSDVQYFLDQSQKHDLQVIMPAGSGEAEWGYACDLESYPKEQTPVWEKEKVTSWMNKWKNHPAVYAWDISNEAGSVMPNASIMNESGAGIPDNYYLPAEQLKTAYADVKHADPSRPIMIRMNGWFFYDNEDHFFRAGNPFDKDIADIVMINAYSNVEEYFPDFVETVTDRAVESTGKLDPHVKIVVAVGSWEEKPLWYMPTVEHLKAEIKHLQNRQDVTGIGFFKYGAKDSEWHLPDQKSGAPELWSVISNI
jgi:hypothetical protein